MAWMTIYGVLRESIGPRRRAVVLRRLMLSKDFRQAETRDYLSPLSRQTTFSPFAPLPQFPRDPTIKLSHHIPFPHLPLARPNHFEIRWWCLHATSNPLWRLLPTPFLISAHSPWRRQSLCSKKPHPWHSSIVEERHERTLPSASMEAIGSQTQTVVDSIADGFSGNGFSEFSPPPPELVESLVKNWFEGLALSPTPVLGNSLVTNWLEGQAAMPQTLKVRKPGVTWEVDHTSSPVASMDGT